jgi:hypothetical protein
MSKFIEQLIIEASSYELFMFMESISLDVVNISSVSSLSCLYSRYDIARYLSFMLMNDSSLLLNYIPRNSDEASDEQLTYTDYLQTLETKNMYNKEHIESVNKDRISHIVQYINFVYNNKDDSVIMDQLVEYKFVLTDGQVIQKSEQNNNLADVIFTDAEGTTLLITNTNEHKKVIYEYPELLLSKLFDLSNVILIVSNIHEHGNVMIVNDNNNKNDLIIGFMNCDGDIITDLSKSGSYDMYHTFLIQWYCASFCNKKIILPPFDSTDSIYNIYVMNYHLSQNELLEVINKYNQKNELEYNNIVHEIRRLYNIV